LGHELGREWVKRQVPWWACGLELELVKRQVHWWACGLGLE